MKDLIKKGLAVGLGLAVTTKEQAQKIVDELVEKGELNRQEAKEFVNELFQKGEETQKEWEQMTHKKLPQMLAQLHVATKEDIERLEQRLEQLEQRQNQPE